MVYFIGIFLFIIPFIAKLQGKFLQSSQSNLLKPIYTFLIILNFSITIFVASNFANYLFYVFLVYALSIFLVFGYFFNIFLTFNKKKINLQITKNFVLKNIYLTLYESVPIFIATILFLLICLFNSNKFSDTGAYINISINIKKNIFSLHQNGNILDNNKNFLHSTIGPYQYSGIYYVYAAWSINDSVVPYYTFLSPLLYWILLTHSINEIILYFWKKKKFFLFLAIFTQLISLFLLLFNFSWITASNNSPFEILYILLLYEIICNNKWKVCKFNMYHPIMALCFFSITGYLFYLPVGIVILIITLCKRNLKFFIYTLFFFICSCFLYLSLLDFFWPGFVSIVIFYFLTIILSNFYWSKIEWYLYKVIYLIKLEKINFIFSKKVNLIKKKLKNSYKKNKISWPYFLFKCLFLILMLIMGVFLSIYNTGLHKNFMLRIALLAIISTQILFCSFSFSSKNAKWTEIISFMYILWFLSEIINAISHLLVENSSAWRFLYLSGNFWLTYIPYIIIIFATIYMFTKFDYKFFYLKIKNKNKQINLKKISFLLIILASVLFITIVFIIELPQISNLTSLYSINVYENIYKYQTIWGSV